LPRKPFDPLALIPPPDVIRERLNETLTLAERLRVLLDVAERLRLPAAADQLPATDAGKGVAMPDALPIPAAASGQARDSVAPSPLDREGAHG
jgi:hypothetical protein